MADNRNVADDVLDYLVYAPVGAILTLVEDLPALAAKGRARVQSQLAVARTVGQFAVSMGGRKVADAVRSRRGASPTSPAAPPAEQAEAGEATAPQPDPSAHLEQPVGVARQRRTSPPSAGRAVLRPHEGDGQAMSAGGVSSLAIPGYDSLAASQVVQRLAGLTADELKAVEEYEKVTRGRRTILGRIAQLSGGSAPVGPYRTVAGAVGSDDSVHPGPGGIETRDPSPT